MNTLIVANWKMYFSHNQADQWLEKHAQELATTIAKKNINFCLCPSFDLLAQTQTIARKTNIALGAQDCSSNDLGACTGQIAAESLAQLGCTYCIVGHSETRKYFNYSNETIAHKALKVIEHAMVPIICVGETFDDYTEQKTTDTLTQQLTPIVKAFAEIQQSQKIILAYEPIWAIGTGTVPSTIHLNQSYTLLKDLIQLYIPQHLVQYIYGGSVDATNIVSLQKSLSINGFLLGSTSTDFQNLKKTIELL